MMMIVSIGEDVSEEDKLTRLHTRKRPKLTWKKLMEKDCREWKLTTVDPQERSTWRSGVRSAMRADSQLPGRGPTDVDNAPASCTLIKNPIMMYGMMISLVIAIHSL